MDNNTDTPNKSKSCCGTDKSGCKKRCCVGKAIVALVVLGAVAAIAYCAGTQHASPRVGQNASETRLSAAEISKIPSLNP